MQRVAYQSSQIRKDLSKIPPALAGSAFMLRCLGGYDNRPNIMPARAQFSNLYDLPL